MAGQDELLDFKNDRDASLKKIEWFKIDRVRGARMLVVGAGAIGNEVLKNLALLGVGHVYVFDRDTIEMSNLSRSILYRAADSGRKKAFAAATAIEGINPNVHANSFAGDVRFDLGLGLLRRMDCVIGCLDNRETRLALNGACMRVGVPWIDAGIDTMDGHVQAFDPSGGPCYECAFRPEDFEEMALSCSALASKFEASGHVPTTPTIASIVAGVQVQEALKLLDPESWRGRNLLGRKFRFSGTKGEAEFLNLTQRDDCGAHDRMQPDKIIELPELRSEHNTVADLLEVARGRLGPEATVELNYELAVKAPCPGCGQMRSLHEPKLKLYREDLWCKKCSGDAAKSGSAENVNAREVNERRRAWQYVVGTHLLGDTNNSFTEELSGMKLSEIGVPRLDILEAQGPGGDVLYLELTGDLNEIL